MTDDSGKLLPSVVRVRKKQLEGYVSDELRDIKAHRATLAALRSDLTRLQRRCPHLDIVSRSKGRHLFNQCRDCDKTFSAVKLHVGG